MNFFTPPFNCVIICSAHQRDFFPYSIDIRLNNKETGNAQIHDKEASMFNVLI